jgi:prepilin peptidase CpaA
MLALHDYILFILIIIAFYTDVRYKKLPNWLTASGMLIGIIYHLIQGGANGLVFSFIGLLVGGGIFLILYLFRTVGAGDVKLFAAIGAIVGVEVVLYIMMYSIIFAGILAIIILLFTRTFLHKMLEAGMALMQSITSRDLETLDEYKVTKATRFPFMYAVVPAVIVAYYYFLTA